MTTFNTEECVAAKQSGASEHALVFEPMAAVKWCFPFSYLCASVFICGWKRLRNGAQLLPAAQWDQFIEQDSRRGPRVVVAVQLRFEATDPSRLLLF